MILAAPSVLSKGDKLILISRGITLTTALHGRNTTASIEALIGFSSTNLDPLDRLRRAYRLCRRATYNIERSRVQGCATRDKAEYLAHAILNLRDIQEEIERAGSELKQQTERTTPSSPE